MSSLRINGALVHWTDLEGRAGKIAADRFSANTRLAYAKAIARFEAWRLAGRKPFDGRSVAEYLALRHDTGAAHRSLRLIYAALRRAAELTRQALDWTPAAQVLSGARTAARDRAELPPEPNPPKARRIQAHALRLPDVAAAARRLLQIAASLPPASELRTRLLRDRALIVIGFLSALRAAELAALKRGDVQALTGPPRLEIIVRKTKTSTTPETIVIPAGRERATCPVAAWRDYLDAIDLRLAPLFPESEPAWYAATRGGLRLTTQALRAHEQIGRILRAALKLADIEDAATYSAHSLRAGLATELACAGTPIPQIANAGRWSSLQTVLGYARRARSYADSPLHALAY